MKWISAPPAPLALALSAPLLMLLNPLLLPLLLLPRAPLRRLGAARLVAGLAGGAPLSSLGEGRRRPTPRSRGPPSGMSFSLSPHLSVRPTALDVLLTMGFALFLCLSTILCSGCSFFSPIALLLLPCSSPLAMFCWSFASCSAARLIFLPFRSHLIPFNCIYFSTHSNPTSQIMLFFFFRLERSEVSTKSWVL